jgi:heterodisulfide reductase subunit B
LILGYNPWDLGLQMHQTDCESVLDKIGIDYDPDEKYNTSIPDEKVRVPNMVKV